MDFELSYIDKSPDTKCVYCNRKMNPFKSIVDFFNRKLHLSCFTKIKKTEMNNDELLKEFLIMYRVSNMSFDEPR